MAELADAQDLGSCIRKDVSVRPRPRPPLEFSPRAAWCELLHAGLCFGPRARADWVSATEHLDGSLSDRGIEPEQPCYEPAGLPSRRGPVKRRKGSCAIPFSQPVLAARGQSAGRDALEKTLSRQHRAPVHARSERSERGGALRRRGALPLCRGDQQRCRGCVAVPRNV